MKICPIVHVSWYEAEAFCNWARASSSQRNGMGGCRVSQETERQAHHRLSAAIFRGATWRQLPNTPISIGISPASSEVGAYAAGDSAFGCRQMIGNIWEWTADDFQPYPGFVVDPYKEYSKPWFGTHKVLRGGCWATSSLLIRNTWRNFYTPDRRDVWAGFRTCAK